MFKIAVVFVVLLTQMANAETLRVPLVSIPTEINPAKTLDISAAIITNQVFEGLFNYGSSNKLVDGIAQSFRISADGKIYTLKLKKGIKFSNNVPVNARMVKKSLENSIAALGITSQWAFGMVEGFDAFIEKRQDQITGIKTIGNDELTITLKTPHFPFLQVFTAPYFKIATKEKGKYIGTGPYYITGQKTNSITLEALPWHKKWLAVDKIIFEKVPSRKHMVEKENIGKYDVIEVLSPWSINV